MTKKQLYKTMLDEQQEIRMRNEVLEGYLTRQLLASPTDEATKRELTRTKFNIEGTKGFIKYIQGLQSKKK